MASSYGISPSKISIFDEELVVINSGEDDLSLRFKSDVLELSKEEVFIESYGLEKIKILENKGEGFLEVYSNDGMGLLVKVVHGDVLNESFESFSFDNVSLFFVLLVVNLLLIICLVVGWKIGLF